MLNDLLGESALFLAAATILLLAAGRRRLPGLVLRFAAWAILALVLGVASRHVGLHPGSSRPVTIPGPTDAWVVVSVLAGLVAMAAPRRWWVAGSLALAGLAVASAIYVVYLGSITLILSESPISLVLGIVLFAIEVLALLFMGASVFEMLDALCRPIVVPVLPGPPSTWPTVAIQVPAHQEPPDLVIESIRRLAAMQYPREHLVIQVLDNNTTDENLWRPLEDACAELRAGGVRIDFYHLEDWPGYKAGALNYGTGHLPPDVEIIAIVDADYLVDPTFLASTVPYFRDPEVAFVQTPQEYRSWEKSAFYRACHAGFAYFFRVGMISRAYRNSIIFAGTMGLIRRSALEAIGGWDEAIITEDAEASLRILALGHRGLYVPTAFGRGIMPLTYEGLRQQRFRWAFGGIQILRKHWRVLLPWSQSGLDQRQRRDYLFGGLWWFNDALTLGFAAFIAATAIGVLANRPFVVQRLAGIGLVLPLLYIALGLLRYLWGMRIATRVSLGESVAALRVNLSLSWVVTLACVRGLVERRGVFLRTPKFAGSATARSLRLVSVETGLAVAAGLLALGVLFVAGFSVLTLTVDTLLVWSVLIYGSATSYALGDPSRPPESLRQKASLELGERALRGAPAQAAAMSALVICLVAFAVAIAGESGQAPVGGGAVPIPPLRQGGITAVGSPAPATAPIATPATGSAAPSSAPVATPAPTPSPTPPATPTPAPATAPPTLLATPTP